MWRTFASRPLASDDPSLAPMPLAVPPSSDENGVLFTPQRNHYGALNLANPPWHLLSETLECRSIGASWSKGLPALPTFELISLIRTQACSHSKPRTSSKAGSERHQVSDIHVEDSSGSNSFVRFAAEVGTNPIS